MGACEGDQEARDATLRDIRGSAPEVVKVWFQTVDQDYVGFELAGAQLSSGDDLADVDPQGFTEIAERVWPLISSIGWTV